MAVLGATEKASDLVREIPFAARTSLLVFDFKLMVLAAIFVYAFFRFTWCIRQYSVGVLLVAAAPEAAAIADEAQRQAFADRAGRVMGLAAESFNDGLRAYYMSFAAAVVVRLAVGHAGGHGGRHLGAVPARIPLRSAAGA